MFGERLPPLTRWYDPGERCYPEAGTRCLAIVTQYSEFVPYQGGTAVLVPSESVVWVGVEHIADTDPHNRLAEGDIIVLEMAEQCPELTYYPRQHHGKTYMRRPVEKSVHVFQPALINVN